MFTAGDGGHDAGGENLNRGIKPAGRTSDRVDQPRLRSLDGSHRSRRAVLRSWLRILAVLDVGPHYRAGSGPGRGRVGGAG